MMWLVDINIRYLMGELLLYSKNDIHFEWSKRFNHMFGKSTCNKNKGDI